MESIRRPIDLVMAISALVSLSFIAQAADQGQEPEKGSIEPPYFEVPKDHAAMHRAVTEARKTVGEFIAALKHPAPGQQDFEIKKPFVQNGQVEHIWLSDVQLVGNRFQGRIDNQPRKIQGLKLGQLVSINRNEISDWLRPYFRRFPWRWVSRRRVPWWQRPPVRGREVRGERVIQFL